MKDKIFKFLFPVKWHEVEEQDIMVQAIVDDLNNACKEIASLKEANNTFASEAIKGKPKMSDLMRESIGLPMIDFNAIDEDGKPLNHYLHGLPEEARKKYIADMAQIYSNEVFKTVLAYTINLIGNHSIQKAEESNMRNGRYAIVGIRTLTSQLEDAYKEHLLNQQQEDEGFDEHEV